MEDHERGWKVGRFTSPTHVVLAFSKALDELEAEGGIPARHRRYAENNRLLIEKMRAMGFAPYIDGSRQGPIITTFFYPAGVPFQFSEFYTYIKERGYVLYPGKLTDADTFRVATSERSTRRILRNLLPSSPASWPPIRRRSHDPGRHL